MAEALRVLDGLFEVAEVEMVVGNVQGPAVGQVHQGAVGHDPAQLRRQVREVREEFAGGAVGSPTALGPARRG
ncbi:hypothetical protein GCM10020256_53370 [Streptomyces thermocoprophilus]